jgi:hypothetical protein
MGPRMMVIALLRFGFSRRTSTRRVIAFFTFGTDSCLEPVADLTRMDRPTPTSLPTIQPKEYEGVPLLRVKSNMDRLVDWSGVVALPGTSWSQQPLHDNGLVDSFAS